MNKKRTVKTISKIRKDISNLQYFDNEIFTMDELKKLEDIRLFFVEMSIKIKEF